MTHLGIRHNDRAICISDDRPLTADDLVELFIGAMHAVGFHGTAIASALIDAGEELNHTLTPDTKEQPHG